MWIDGSVVEKIFALVDVIICFIIEKQWRVETFVGKQPGKYIYNEREASHVEEKAASWVKKKKVWSRYVVPHTYYFGDNIIRVKNW